MNHAISRLPLVILLTLLCVHTCQWIIFRCSFFNKEITPICSVNRTLPVNWCLPCKKVVFFRSVSSVTLENRCSVTGLSSSPNTSFNTLRPRQDGRHFPDDILKWIFLNENLWISLKISLKFVPKVRIDNILTLVQIMAWHQLGDKPLSEPIMVYLLTHICVTRPQWIN